MVYSPCVFNAHMPNFKKKILVTFEVWASFYLINDFQVCEIVDEYFFFKHNNYFIAFELYIFYFITETHFPNAFYEI